MAARKTAKKAKSKRASAKKPVKPVRPAASSKQSELDELRAMKDEVKKDLAELNKAREDFNREQHLARINREMAAGNPPTLQAPTPREETPEQKLARQREEARAERKRKRLEERQQAAQAAAPTPAPMPAPVADLSEARAKKASANSKDKGPVKLLMKELCKYKLEVLNRNYNDALEKIRAAVRPKYEQMMVAEVRQLAAKDATCVAAQKEQIEYVNEIVKEVDPELPEGYAITQLLTEAGLIVAQYVPDRAGKPLPLPGLAPPEEG